MGMASYEKASTAQDLRQHYKSPIKMNSLSLANFKAFGPEIQEASIKPITLIFGPNSSGKSSLIHSMLWLSHSLRGLGSDFNVRIPAGTPEIDLGGFDQFVHQSNSEKAITVGWSCEASNIPDVDNEPYIPKIRGSYDYDLCLRIEIFTNGAGEYSRGICSISFMADEDLLFTAVSVDGIGMAINDINVDHVIVRDLVAMWSSSKITKHSQEEYKKIIKSYAIHNIYHLIDKDIEPWIRNPAIFYNGVTLYSDQTLLTLYTEGTDAYKREDDLCSYFDKKLKFKLLENPESINEELAKIINSLLEFTEHAIQKKLVNMSHVSGLRKLPSRNFDPLNSGDARWKTFATDEKIRNRVNKWIGSDFMNTPYQLGVKRFIAEDFESDCSSSLKASDMKHELFIHDIKSNTKLTLQDVGVGISQVVPVLIEAMANKDTTVCIEQPEIHLHPALQAEMGDVFIESALGENKNTFFLETHSEHLILRILRRIRETGENDMSDWPESLRTACPNGISPDDVAVLYVQSGENGAQLTNLPIDIYGEFVGDWPGGFFEERLKEIF
ncbi:MAG: DUF3696 domain-containing protein [Verrucomicrobiae bacterium]|nr:DUF3696 domain-containing protein [Verrucomicrobiae bacterium]NNJ42127.1 DUF3696 domain-containing protein [Akkermansiaceae bacterium]